jgi:hypothetical protein
MVADFLLTRYHKERGKRSDDRGESPTDEAKAKEKIKTSAVLPESLERGT